MKCVCGFCTGSIIQATRRRGTMALKITSLAHVNINVTDLEKSEKFYTELLGLKVSKKYEGGVVWMNFGEYVEDDRHLGYHDIALYKVPNKLPADYRKTAGMNHVAKMAVVFHVFSEI